jgi:outer membrane protein assembly factor BamB
VYALDGASGTPEWSSDTSYTELSSSPALGADGTVYVGSVEMTARYAASGAIQWSYPAGGCPAIGTDGTVYFGSADFNVYALDGSLGVMKWVFSTGGTVTTCPAIGADGTVYIGSNDGYLYALDGASGAKKWKHKSGGGFSAGPAVGASGALYIGSVDGGVYSLVQGKHAWLSVAAWAGVGIALGVVVATCIGGILCARHRSCKFKVGVVGSEYVSVVLEVVEGAVVCA